MLPRNHPDRIQIAFDDHRLVANAGLLLPVTLAQHLGLREVVDSHVDLGDAPGRANPGDKLLTLVASALAGAQIPHLRLLGWLLWAYSRCGVSTGVLIGLCTASLRGLATVSRQLWSLSG